MFATLQIRRIVRPAHVLVLARLPGLTMLLPTESVEYANNDLI